MGTCGGGVYGGGWVDLCTTWVVFLSIPCSFCAYWRRFSNCFTALDAGCSGLVGVGCVSGVWVFEVLVGCFVRSVTCMCVISVSLFSFTVGNFSVVGCCARLLSSLRASSSSI